MSFRTEATYLNCSGCHDSQTEVYWNIDDLAKGYIKFRRRICDEENTVTISQCNSIDTDGYRETVERFQLNKDAQDRLKKDNQGKSLIMNRHKWWKRQFSK